MKLIIGFVTSWLIFASQGLASGDLGSVVAEGKVTYKMPSGELVSRDVSLEVPARGEGEVVLRSGDWEVRSSNFKSGENHGRKVFVVVFENVPGAPAGSKAVYHGTYMRGSNRAIYYGDVWAKSADQKSSEELNLSLDSSKLIHVGGFYFATEISD
jgi:hypothetical protein